MCEYIPRINRQKAILKTGIFAVLTAGLYGGSLVKGIPFPSLWQIGSLVAATGLILCAAGKKGWMRKYFYTVAPRRDLETDIPDFTVSEQLGKRFVTDCVISLEDIDEILEVNSDTVAKIGKSAPFYHYAPDLPASERRILRVHLGETEFFVEIAVNGELLNALNFH